MNVAFGIAKKRWLVQPIFIFDPNFVLNTLNYFK